MTQVQDHAPSRVPPRRASASGVLPPLVAWSYLALALVCGAVYLRDSGGPGGTVSLVLVDLGTLAAISFALRRNRPVRARAWRLLQAGLAVAFVGAVLRSTLAGTTLGAVGGDTFALLTYPFLFAWLGHLLRARDPGAQVDTVIDGLLVGIAAFLLAWVFLVSPALSSDVTPTAERLLWSTFPVLDAVIIFLVVRLVFLTSGRVPSIWLLIAGLGFVFLGDVGYALHAAEPLPLGVGLLDAPYLYAYGLAGAAVLHPSMRTLTTRAPVVVRPLPRGRLVAVSVAVAVPALLVLLRPLVRPADRVVVAASILILAAVVLWRTFRAVNQHAASEQRLAQQATHDPLTQLPNRVRLLQRLRESLVAARELPDRSVAVLFCDLDGFKFVNDSWGHSVGDELLLLVGARLRETARGEDLVGRAGGDEFVVIHEAATADLDLPRVARRVLSAFAEAFPLSIGEVYISASIGIATSEGRGPASGPEDLIRDADTAMYRAKSEGRNRWVRYDESMRNLITHRLRTEFELRRALERDELRVHYQPIVDVGEGRLQGFEALVRWQHPERGLLPPAEFIPLIEDTDLILPVGERVLRLAAEELVRSRAQVDGGDRLSVSVNVAARQLRDPGFVEVVRSVLHGTGLPAKALALEITESTMVEDSEATRVKLAALRRLGVGLHVDDFGTGYSSLRYLKKFPVTMVKIDRAFVDGLGSDHDDEVIVAAVLAMAHALGLEVVAEGVETTSQRERLRSLGCDFAQGYLFGRPEAVPVRSMTLPSLVGPTPSASRKLTAK